MTAPSDAAEAHALLDRHGFSAPFSLGGAGWGEVPEAPGVYVIFEGAEVVYVGMAGRSGAGSLRRRLRDHASGQIVNMFAQYLLFARILFGPDAPRKPRAAATRCRDHIRGHCSARFRVLADASAARSLESELPLVLRPRFNPASATRRAKSEDRA